MDELTDEFLDEWAHKLLGYCVHDWSGVEQYIDPIDKESHELGKCVHCGKYEGSDVNFGMPAYCNDLNAARLVELAVIEAKGFGKYDDALIETTASESQERAIMATARQRVTAACRAMNGEPK